MTNQEVLLQIATLLDLAVNFTTAELLKKLKERLRGVRNSDARVSKLEDDLKITSSQLTQVTELHSTSQLELTKALQSVDTLRDDIAIQNASVQNLTHQLSQAKAAQ